MFNVLIATGGTGGHIYPAITIGRFLKENNINVIFSGRKNSMEEKLISAYGFEMVFTKGEKFKGVNIFHKLLVIFKLVRHIFSSVSILKKHKINYLLGTGGFMSVPMVIAAYFLKIRSGICEQNAYMGFGNRVLSFFVNDIFLSFNKTLKVPFKYKAVVTGNFIRKEFENISSETKGILIFGGSQGAKQINKLFVAVLDKLKNIENLKIYHITGENNFNEIEKIYKKNSNSFQYEIFPYYEKIWELFSKVELIISRAGATSIAEIYYNAKKAVLIPYPYAADNHQWYNAVEFAKSGKGVILKQKQLTEEKFFKWINFFLNNEQRFVKDYKVLGDYKEGLKIILERVKNV
jgi:UDP-N-acetylglucosamine--N-acetylmuramyl-(pentapeptide) pyrophosphoryl-undecaprenol N-acetylglucosamine transferase